MNLLTVKQILSGIFGISTVYCLCKFTGLNNIYALFVFAPINLVMMFFAYRYIEKMVKFGGPVYCITNGLACADRALGTQVRCAKDYLNKSDLRFSVFLFIIPGLSLWMFTMTVIAAYYDALKLSETSIMHKYWTWRGLVKK